VRRDLQRLRAAEADRPVAASCRALPVPAGVGALETLAEEILVAAMAEPAALRLPRRMLVGCCQAAAAATSQGILMGGCHVAGHIVTDATARVPFALGVPRVALVEQQGAMFILPERHAAEQRHPSQALDGRATRRRSQRNPDDARQ
jgi:hypothetical protein